MSGSALLLLSLLSLLLLSAGSDSSRIRKRGLNHKDYEYPNHPQSTQQQKNDRCPPPPQMLPEKACEVPGCRSDSECERHKRCCYNGCIYACLESVQPPPVLDWLVQPKPRWLGGNGWLLDGPEEVLQAEACSTTEDGDEPLHCPTGYECHIINPGNPAAGIPNRGQCIKQRGNSEGRLRHKYSKDYKDYLARATEWTTKKVITSTWDKIGPTSGSPAALTQPETSPQSCSIRSHHRIPSDLSPDLQRLPPPP
uniref:WAP four-disulfide core domain protein 1 n=1 Tax=Gasterosteus aculeatus aculeatus TaxID=481459 RepID=G3PKQ8_GASAC